MHVLCLIAKSSQNACPQGGGKQTTNLGQLFFGFLRRFGSHFNLYTDAVAIGLGGIVSKKSASVSGEDIGLPKLCVQDINTLRSVHTMLPAHMDPSHMALDD